MEAFGFFAAIIGLITACVTLFYAAARGIDYFFTKKDDHRRHCYRIKEIKCAGKQGTRMTNDLIKQINDSVFDMTKKMMELE